VEGLGVVVWDIDAGAPLSEETLEELVTIVRETNR